MGLRRPSALSSWFRWFVVPLPLAVCGGPRAGPAGYGWGFPGPLRSGVGRWPHVAAVRPAFSWNAGCAGSPHLTAAPAPRSAGKTQRLEPTTRATMATGRHRKHSELCPRSAGNWKTGRATPQWPLVAAGSSNTGHATVATGRHRKQQHGPRHSGYWPPQEAATRATGRHRKLRASREASPCPARASPMRPTLPTATTGRGCWPGPNAGAPQGALAHWGRAPRNRVNCPASGQAKRYPGATGTRCW